MLLILAYLFSDIFLINLNHHNYIPSVSASPATIILRPNGPGDSTQLYQYPTTGENWDKVDDEIPDGDATYVYIIGGNALDLYAIEDPPINIGTINSVTIYAYCIKEGGNPNLYICIRTQELLMNLAHMAYVHNMNIIQAYLLLILIQINHGLGMKLMIYKQE
jgi:hypothetical protein